MVLRKIFMVLAGLLFLPPLYAGQVGDSETATNDAGQEAAGSSMEQPAGERRDSLHEVIREPVELDNMPVYPGISQHDEAMEQRHEAVRSRHQQRIEAARQQQEERIALTRKRQEDRLEKFLKQQEERQKQVEQRHEAMRNRAEEEHNYLIKHHEEMLEQELQSKIEFANYHENLRKNAEERRKKVAAFRARMRDMTVEERREYMDMHREELFGPGSQAWPSGLSEADRYAARRGPPPRFRPPPAPEMPSE